MREERSKVHGPGSEPASDPTAEPRFEPGRTTAAPPPRGAADAPARDTMRDSVPGQRDTARDSAPAPAPGPGHGPGHGPGDTPPVRGLPDESSAERLAREDHPLLEPGDAKGYRTAWQSIQSDFVDRPKEAVREADALVAEVIRTLAASFTTHKDALEAHWAKGDDVVTEDLRVALQRYRSFFNRLLNT